MGQDIELDDAAHADHGAPALYKKFGFELTAPKSVGMAMRM